MNRADRFFRALAALPAAVRERLDDRISLDWLALGDQATALAVEEAARIRSRLPAPVEALVERLVREIGIAPPEVVSGIDGKGAAGSWIHWVAIEPDGESYRARNRRSGELHAGIRPDVLVGYAVLGLELAVAWDQVREAWTEAGEKALATPDSERDALLRWAAHLHGRLRELLDTASGPPSILAQARAFEDAWNAQTLRVREELATHEMSLSDGARAPRPSYYAVETGYRLYAYDTGEARWLLALAAEATNTEPAAEVREKVSSEESSQANAPTAVADMPGSVTQLPTVPTRESQRSEDPAPGVNGVWNMTAMAGLDNGETGVAVLARLGAEPIVDDSSLSEALKLALASDGAALDDARGNADGTGVGDDGAPVQDSAAGPAPDPGHGGTAAGTRPSGTPDAVAGLQFGSTLERWAPQDESDLLAQVAKRLPPAVTRRLGEACGAGTLQFLTRLRTPEGGRELHDALGKEAPGDAVPEWVEELAAALLLDTGVQTHDGLRTGPARLSPGMGPEGYRIIEVETSEWGYFRPIDFVEQIRLSLSFASNAWTATMSLGSAGTEAEWILRGAAVKDGRLSTEEGAKLEAAREIAEEVLRVRRDFAEGSSAVPSALEQADLTVSALRSVAHATRVSAGWPTGAEVPNPRDSGDIARMARVAETLHADVRAIANRLIVAQVGTDHTGVTAQAG